MRRTFSPVVSRPDGKTLITVMNTGSAPIYRSTDQGLSWHFGSDSAVIPGGIGAVTYDALIQLPSGGLQTYYVHALG